MYTILILLYANDVILMAHTHEGMVKLLRLLKTFCDKSGLTINVTKTKMLSCSREREKHFKYNENIHDFNYLGIEIPSTHTNGANAWTDAWQPQKGCIAC